MAKHWYAAMTDSYNFDEAMQIATEYYNQGFTDALVAEVDEGLYGTDAECIAEYYVKEDK